ncbi:ZIP family metal transporter [Candidatus Shapirobacteria bacterium]|nr:ZIP family metal transporter [Candidatus Shapirobacteria bacterium]
MSSLFFSLVSVTIIGLLSIFSIYFLLSKVPRFTKLTSSLVSLAVGSLLGDAFIHLLPEANETIGSSLLVSLLTVGGILIFFIIEKVVRWRHCHNPECLEDEDHLGHHSDHVVTNSLIGELFHNFIDGVIIASSFMVSPALGFTTSLAVLIHEIPQEIGDFAIYLHQGKSLSESLKLNFYTALSAYAGVIVTVLIGQSFVDFSNYMLPLTAGGFIYLASSDLIPELHRHEPSTKSSFTQILLVILGVFLMCSLLLLE